jgi:hypothetical protein
LLREFPKAPNFKQSRDHWIEQNWANPKIQIRFLFFTKKRGNFKNYEITKFQWNEAENWVKSIHWLNSNLNEVQKIELKSRTSLADFESSKLLR